MLQSIVNSLVYCLKRPILVQPWPRQFETDASVLVAQATRRQAMSSISIEQKRRVG